MYVCMYVRMYVYVCIYMYVCTVVVVVVAGDPLRSDATCHLVAVRGTPTRLCDRTDFPKVYIRFVLQSVIQPHECGYAHLRSSVLGPSYTAQGRNCVCNLTFRHFHIIIFAMTKQ
jgi:hypothetical protein